MEFQFKHLPFLCFKKHLTHFLKKKKKFISGKNIIFLVLRNIQALKFILKNWIVNHAKVTRVYEGMYEGSL